MKRKKDRILEQNLYITGCILLAVLGVLFAAERLLHLEFQGPPCVFYYFTGYYCPGCGGTRAFRELLRGHFFSSFLYHPVVLYGAGLYFWFLFSHTVEKVSKGYVKIAMRYTDGYLYGAVVLILIQWILKNLIKAVWGISLL